MHFSVLIEEFSRVFCLLFCIMPAVGVGAFSKIHITYPERFIKLFCMCLSKKCIKSTKNRFLCRKFDRKLHFSRLKTTNSHKFAKSQWIFITFRVKVSYLNSIWTTMTLITIVLNWDRNPKKKLLPHSNFCASLLYSVISRSFNSKNNKKLMFLKYVKLKFLWNFNLKFSPQ